MKNRFIVIGILLIVLTLLTIFNKEKDDKKIVVAEVTHSVFYAPWYVSLKNNYFDDLNIEVILTSGANNVVASVISGDANIGLCGPEATIYAYKDSKDPVINFASLTKKDGQFLILRKNIKYNSIKDLENLTILAGRSGGMPLLSFSNALSKNNVKAIIDSSVDFSNLTSAFISGMGDGVNLFEPNATLLVKKGYGYIAESIGNLSGDVPYTTFNAKKSYINNNKEIIKKFYNGINKGLEFVKNNDATTIANTIKEYFLDTNFNDLVNMINNYKKYDSWYTTANIKEKDFNNLENIMINNNTISEYVKFNNLVYEVN